MKQKTINITYGVVLVFLTVFIILVANRGKNRMPNTPQTNNYAAQPVQTLCPMSIPENDNWKTCSGTSGTFTWEFKYPAQWPTAKISEETREKDAIFKSISLGPLSPDACEGSPCYATDALITTSPVSAFLPEALETPEKVLADFKTPGGGILISDEMRSDGSRMIIYYALGESPTVIAEIFYPPKDRKLHATFKQRTEDPKEIRSIADSFKFSNSAPTSNSTPEASF